MKETNKAMEMTQELVDMCGNTAITAVHRGQNTVYVLTNNTVFNRFDFVQEFVDEDSAWNKAEAISRFEKDFANACYCSVNEEGEIELWCTDKDTVQIYQLFCGELWKHNLGTGLRVATPHKDFKLPSEAADCINYINSKIRSIINVNAFGLLNSPLTRVEINSGETNRSYNIDTTTYNSIKHRLKRCGNIKAAHNLIIANGGVRHQEAIINNL